MSLADVDEILRIGRERTDALTTRLDREAEGANADGSGVNLLDFKMDSTNMQEFEGVNYKEEKERKAREALELQQLMALELVNHVANSMGTRERNRPQHLEEADAARESLQVRSSVLLHLFHFFCLLINFFHFVLSLQVSMRPTKAPRSMKLPKAMRLPRMQVRRRRRCCCSCSRCCRCRCRCVVRRASSFALAAPALTPSFRTRPVHCSRGTFTTRSASSTCSACSRSSSR